MQGSFLNLYSELILKLLVKTFPWFLCRSYCLWSGKYLGKIIHELLRIQFKSKVLNIDYFIAYIITLIFKTKKNRNSLEIKTHSFLKKAHFLLIYISKKDVKNIYGPWLLLLQGWSTISSWYHSISFSVW